MLDRVEYGNSTCEKTNNQIYKVLPSVRYFDLEVKGTVSRILEKFRHEKMDTNLSEMQKERLKPVKEHFNTTANTKQGTDGQQFKKIKTDYEKDF